MMNEQVMAKVGKEVEVPLVPIARDASDTPLTEYHGPYALRGPIYASLWLPAIPMPFLGLRKRCECGRRFWTLDGYRAHFALVHVLERS